MRHRLTETAECVLITSLYAHLAAITAIYVPNSVHAQIAQKRVGSLLYLYLIRKTTLPLQQRSCLSQEYSLLALMRPVAILKQACSVASLLVQAAPQSTKVLKLLQAACMLACIHQVA